MTPFRVAGLFILSSLIVLALTAIAVWAVSGAAPPGPPELPQVVWDGIVFVVAALAGWLARHFAKKK